MEQIRFEDRVAIVTGAGGGLGRAHALAFAARGAKVIVNDLGAGRDAVVAEIEAAGGEAIASGASVTDPSAVTAMVAAAIERFGHVDILINNAGILRDKSFAKMEMDDFRVVVDVHLMGAVYCTKAVWAHMRERRYGRIVMTTSSSGLYGNFGQANYGAAKMGLVGLANTLAIEGAKDDIRVNCLAPTARTQMTEGLIPEAILANYTPESVSPGVLFLASENAPTHAILLGGAGSFERAHVAMTVGDWFAEETRTPEAIAEAWEAISSHTGESVPMSGAEQGAREVQKIGSPAKA